MKLSVLALLACGATPPAEVAPTQPEKTTFTKNKMSEPMTHIKALSNRSSKQMAERAEAWLMSHPADSHPLLLEALKERGAGTARVMRVLGKMGQADSVSEIAAVLSEGDELLAPAAANALAHHGSNDALQPLIDGAQSTNQHSRHAALVGLRQRGNPSACTQLTPLLGHSDPITRYQSLRTLAELGCLNSGDAQRLAHDDDPDVKALAEELLNPAE